MYHSAQNTPSGVQSGWATTYLADSVPSVTLQGRCALQNVDPVVMQHTGLPSSGLVEFYVRQVVCVCFYSLCKNMYYTCNIGYTARWAVLPLDSALPFLGCKYLLNDLYNTHRPPLCRVLLAAQFADVIEGAADFLLRPPYCATIRLSTRPDRQWGSQTRPGAWHLNSARGLAIWRAGCKGGWGLSLDFPFLVVVEYERLCNSSLWWNNIYSPALFTLLLICVIWLEMQIGLF